MGALVILHKVERTTAVNIGRIQSVASDKEAIFTALALRVCIGFLIRLGKIPFRNFESSHMLKPPKTLQCEKQQQLSEQQKKRFWHNLLLVVPWLKKWR